MPLDMLTRISSTRYVFHVLFSPTRGRIVEASQGGAGPAASMKRASLSCAAGRLFAALRRARALLESMS
jgi:hypothetical protein